jgi:hypothetical protein
MLIYVEKREYSDRVYIDSFTREVSFWIEYNYVPPYAQIETNDRMRDWKLFIKRRGEPALCYKCPLRLEVESRLRAWLLQRFHRRLSDLRFEELCAIAQGKYPTPKRRVKLKWSK